MHTIGTNSKPIEKIFYVFWFVFADMLKFILIDCNYIFTFSLNGFYTMFPFDKEQMLKNLNDEKLIGYFNYSCRALAFLVRRHAYLLRNTVLNDPIPVFIDLNDRLKARSLDIQEVCIKSFKNELIKKINYPMESIVANNSRNYFRQNSVNIENELSELLNYDSSTNNEENLDFVHDIKPETSLLIRDYDPRYIDPVFNETVNYQKASLDLLNRFIEDRRLIMQI